MRRSLSEAESDLFCPGETAELRSFVVGPLIAKGANAAVYAARKAVHEGIYRYIFLFDLSVLCRKSSYIISYIS